MNSKKLLAQASLTHQMEKKQNLLIETDQACVMKDAYPKAKYHFLVVAKEDIPNVTALTREHLDLLDHMMDLANEIIERQKHLESSNFKVGFKVDAFMKCLTMHVISDDFYSESMRKVKHWNSFNTDLFLTYQAVYALLRLQGYIEPMPDGEAENLRKAMPLKCNQCDFSTDILVSLKGHLFEHWQKRERKFEVQKQVDKLTSLLDEATLDSEPCKNLDEVPLTVDQTKLQTNTELSKNSKPKEGPSNWRRKTPVEDPQKANQSPRGPGNASLVVGNNRPGIFPYPNSPQSEFQHGLYHPQRDYPNLYRRYPNPQQMGNGHAPNFQPPFNMFCQNPNAGQIVPFRFNGPRPQYRQQQNISQSQPNVSKPNWRPKGPINQAQATSESSGSQKVENVKNTPKCQQEKSRALANKNQNASLNNQPKGNAKPAESVSSQQSSGQDGEKGLTGKAFQVRTIEDIEYERGRLTRLMEAGEDVVLQTDMAAVLRNSANPKAEYHFLVLPKVDIINVTALRREHLPILNHMMQLAQQVIDLHNLPHNIFEIGFKINAFMNRLNMHVISYDFCSDYMRRISHWNTFNTELFIKFPAVCGLLLVRGCIPPISPERAEALSITVPVCCNQCRYVTHNFAKFKDHLKEHWMKKKADNGNSRAPLCGSQQGPRTQSGPTARPRPPSRLNQRSASGGQQESGYESESQLNRRAPCGPQEVTKDQSGLHEKTRPRSRLNQRPESGDLQERGYRSRSMQEPRTGPIQQQGLSFAFPPFPGPRPEIVDCNRTGGPLMNCSRYKQNINQETFNQYHSKQQENRHYLRNPKLNPFNYNPGTNYRNVSDCAKIGGPIRSRSRKIFEQITYDI